MSSVLSSELEIFLVFVINWIFVAVKLSDKGNLYVLSITANLSLTSELEESPIKGRFSSSP